ncbi:armadillo repeat-containing protein 1-like [Mercenaria mercenaria]|uniref:armadillo repeat-containing protein 1-like n=1 Tax=Mercenaria mercenaria TaxID=6596 RepID=UPI001E1D831D|nr:armadillo repeat-containing protein 1-like [Mercenaria mercenaria]XP_045157273.1 armadillo repeat-containing protein 1-like [Mercenaria mercenaria]
MVSCEAIQAMKTMAMDVKKRAILVKDSTCIGGLVLVLSNPDENVVKLALETIHLLAETADHRPLLRGFIGMMEQLESLIDRKDCGEVECMAKEVYMQLKQDSQVTPLKDNFNTSANKSRRSSMQKMLHGGYKNSKIIVLQLKGLLNKCDRDVCMRLLLQVKGVISITFDMNKKRCIVRAKLDVRPESLVQAIAKTQSIHAQQVVKNDSGEEMFLSFGTRNDKLNKENESDLPDYLPDDEELQPIDDKAISRNKPDSTSGGWLSSAASFLANSFYW